MVPDKVIRLQTGVSAVHPAHTGSIWSLTTAALPGGQSIIVAASADGTLQRLDIGSGDPIGDPITNLIGPSWSLAATVLADGRSIVVSGGGDGMLRRLDAGTGELIGDPIVGHEGRVWAVAATGLPDGHSIIVSGGADGTVRRFDAGTGQVIGNPIASPVGHPGPVLSVTVGALSSGRTAIVSGGEDGLVRRFDAETGDAIGKPITSHGGRVQSVALVALTGDRTIIVVGSGDGTVQRFDARSGDPIGDPMAWHTGRVWAISAAMLPDGRMVIVSGGEDGTIRRFDAETGDPIGDPILGRGGRVLSLAVISVPDGRTIIVSGGSNRTLHRYNACTGDPIGEPISDPAGRVWSVAIALLPRGRTVIVSGGDDGTVRLFDAQTGDSIGDPVVAHAGRVWSVTAIVLADGRTVIVSGGEDGTIRRLDAETGDCIGDPITGPADHMGPVLSVVGTTLPDGRTVIVSGGGDGTVRRFDGQTGDPMGDPIIDSADSTGPVSSVADGVLPDGRVIIASGGDDGSIRRFDAQTGDSMGDPIIGPAGHTGPVMSVALAELPDGRTMIVSGGDDGTVRRFDAQTGQVVGDPINAHSGITWSVAAARMPDGRTIIVSCGDDETVQCFDAVTGEPIGEPITGLSGPSWSVRIGALPNGRTIIASGGNGGAFVIWPSGIGTGMRTEAPALVDSSRTADELGRGVLASHLAGLLGQLTDEQEAHCAVVHIDGRWGSGKTSLVQLLLERMNPPDGGVSQGHSSASSMLQNPLVIHYDAWRESAISPEWWSLATAINRTVRAARSRFTRMYLTFWMIAARTFRSPPTIVAILLFIVALVSWRVGLRSGSAATVRALITALTGLAALALSVGRLLFWYAPTLHMRTNDNPLGDIAALVGWLRRWSPRDPKRQRNRDRMIGLLLATLMIAFIAGLIVQPPPAIFPVILALFSVATIATIAWHIQWCRHLTPSERRPLMLIIDDLDRCDADRVVKLLEAVHTLLREPGMRRAGWKMPARLIILVIADGRWVRTSFQSEFGEFAALGSPVHNLGADFAQKLFDHTVLVPALSADQIRRFVQTELQPRMARQHGGANETRRVLQGSQMIMDQAIRQIEQVGPADLRTETVSARIEDPALSTRDRFVLEEIRARREASPEAVALRRDHLLQEYGTLMPANPRLIKRVANTFGMLLALKGHLGHSEDIDTVVRAAIMLVRFPSLVDELLTAARLPAMLLSDATADSTWLQPDVRQLLAGCEVSRLARCYGREYVSQEY